MAKKDTLLIFASIVSGIIFGLVFPDLSKKIKIVGDIFLTLLKMLVIPLVIISITSAIVNLRSIDKLKKLGTYSIFLYFFTMIIAVLVGIGFVLVVDPSQGISFVKKDFQVVSKSFEEFILGFFPANIFRSLSEGSILHVIFFFVLFSIAILKVEKNVDQVANLLNYLLEIFMVIVKWVISLTFIGVFCIISNLVANFGLDAFKGLYKYAICVVGGILFHGGIIIPLIVWILSGVNVYKLMGVVLKALLFAFSTCSSSATLPVSMSVCTDGLKLRKEVVEFVLPLGATVNMNGTALYEAVAALFVAGIFGVNLSLFDYVIVSITSVLAAVGAAAIPGAGLVTMSIVFTAVGIPLEGIAIIVVIDRFLDMFRTAMNVWGDIAIAIIANYKVK
ncbi:MAG: dicarboxylate/amino acid:cation symporter [bacterium]